MSIYLYVGETNIGEYGTYHLEYQNFTVSNQHCPITTYNISSSELELLPLADINPVIGSSSFAIPIDTSSVGSIKFSIFGFCLGGSSAASPFLEISIIEPPSEYLDSLTNQAPFFDEEPETVTFWPSDSAYVLSLPSILDSTDNFCEIIIESETLGTYRQSTCLEEIIESEGLISFDRIMNTLEINNQIMGTHTVKIVLRDYFQQSSESTFQIIFSDVP
jgi:hypothetical protein